MYDLAIINGWIVDEDRIYKGNILVKNEKIITITEDAINEDLVHFIINCEGKYIFPGAIDLHSHLGNMNGEPSEDPQHSTAAAAAGGITTCVEMPLNAPKSVVKKEVFLKKKKMLEERCYTDFCMWGALVHDNQQELAGLDEAGAISFKSFLSPAGGDYTSPNVWETREALRAIKKFDGLAGFHCEEYSIIYKEMERIKTQKMNGRQAFLESRPLVAELIAVKNIIELARETGARVHICHCSHPLVFKAINEAKAEGVDISAETCTHYLTFTENDLLQKGCLYKCAPPLRNQEAQEGLWDLLKKGRIEYVASDHSPGMPEDRQDETRPTYEAGNGISGIQTMMQVLFYEAVIKRGISPSIISKVTSSNPAKRLQIYGRKGAVKVGFDADMVIIDPEQEWEIKKESLLYKQKISGFVGMKGKGIPIMTIVRGKLVAKDGKIVEDEFKGKLIMRNCREE